MLGGLLRTVFGSSNERRLKGYKPRIAAINALEAELTAMSDEALAQRTVDFARSLPPARRSMTSSCRPSPPCVKPPSACWASGI